jgi:hypothetical protein
LLCGTSKENGNRGQFSIYSIHLKRNIENGKLTCILHSATSSQIRKLIKLFGTLTVFANLNNQALDVGGRKVEGGGGLGVKPWREK